MTPKPTPTMRLARLLGLALALALGLALVARPATASASLHHQRLDAALHQAEPDLHRPTGSLAALRALRRDLAACAVRGAAQGWRPDLGIPPQPALPATEPACPDAVGADSDHPPGRNGGFGSAPAPVPGCRGPPCRL